MTQGWTSSNLSALPWPNRCVSIRRSRARSLDLECASSQNDVNNYPEAEAKKYNSPWPALPMSLGLLFLSYDWALPTIRATWIHVRSFLIYLYTRFAAERSEAPVNNTDTSWRPLLSLACCRFSVAVNPPSWRKPRPFRSINVKRMQRRKTWGECSYF